MKVHCKVGQSLKYFIRRTFLESQRMGGLYFTPTKKTNETRRSDLREGVSFYGCACGTPQNVIMFEPSYSPEQEVWEGEG